jgi:uncharacterized protein YndB with AHSA1/START domain
MMATATEKELSFTRVFDAPRALVFKAWTDPKQMAMWFGPKGFTNPVCKVDARKGGAIYIEMKGPDGVLYPMNGTFEEFDEPRKLSFLSGPLDPEGHPLFDVLTLVEFTEAGGKTTLKVTARVLKIHSEDAQQHLAGMEVGWSQTLDRLADHVSRK